MKSQISVLLTILVLILIASCGKNNPASGNENDPPGPPADPGIATKDIGPAGGSLTSKDGLLTLNFPAGALGNVESITVEKVTADDLGSEFDELLQASGISDVYELGPDGLQFDEPVGIVYGSSQNPTHSDDSLKFNSEYLFTSSGGNIELLDSLMTTVDFENGTIQISGNLDHFSPLVTSQVNDGVSFFVFDVPDELELEQSFEARAEIYDSYAGSQPDIISLPGPASYEDKSGTPIVAGFSPLVADLAPDTSNGFKGSFEYSCNDIGLGVYAALLSVNVTFNFESGAINAESFATFRTTVDCIEKALPKKDLVVSLDGSGSGTVVSDPEGIDCPGECENSFTENNDVILDANPAEGSKFTGWTGDIGSNNADDPLITLTMDQDRSVTAIFDEIPSYTLTVLKSGEGSGTVSSDPPGINYGDDNTEDYPENTVVTLTATPDEGSVFQFWSGNIGTENSGSENPIKVTMDQARSVSAVFGKPATAGGIELGLYFLLADLFSPETIFSMADFETFAPPNSQNGYGGSGNSLNIGERIPMLVQGAGGFIVFDLVSNELLLDFTNVSGNDTTFFGLRTPLGALAVSRPDPGPNTASVIASFGLDQNSTTRGFSVYPWDQQQMEYSKDQPATYPPVMDAFPIGGESISDEVVIVREGNFGINFLRYSEPTDSYVLRSRNDNLNINRYGSEPAVTAYGEEVEGALLVVNAVGDLYFETRNGLIPTVNVGNLGQRIIRLRCMLPVCVATDFDGNAVRLITWDGQTEPSIAGNSIGVGAGPVDPDLYTLPNGNILVAVAGFQDNTITLMEVAQNGTPVNIEQYDLPEGCVSPGHVILEDNPDDAANPLVIGTCYESGNYFVNDLQNSGGLFTPVGGM
ncbi:InlB B-repeat-containing protein [Balneola sp. MJW-20]|uniref:InlB B-repeat-containing protein n=1 Tax=Gracilimonas aurantiaca TaxID=3234185 RepID=UPI00390A9C68